MPTAKSVARDPDYEAKLAELERFCNARFSKHGTIQRNIRITVRYLGENSLRRRRFFASAEDIWGQIPRRESTGSFDRKKGSGWVQTHINAVREALNEFYARPESADARFRIRIPYYNEITGRVIGKPYRINFIDKPKPPEMNLRVVPEDPTINLWQQMAHGIDNINRVFLIYDTPDVMSSDPTMNTPDSWSGSGEVSAACLIGQCAAHLRPHLPIDVRRWCDMSFLELEIGDRSLIILGSSLRNLYMQRLRDRERWRPRQMFHFEPPEGNEKHGYICKGGAVGEPGEQDKRYGWEAGPRGSSKEHALVTFFKDVTNRQTLIALQGITTVGTLAATRYMCNAACIAELKKAFEADSIDVSQGVPSFELLLRVHVEKDSSLGDTTFCELKIYPDQSKRIEA